MSTQSTTRRRIAGAAILLASGASGSQAAVWSNFSSTLSPHVEGAAVVAPDESGTARMYVLSGHDGSAYNGDVERFDGATWSVVTTIPGGGRRLFAAVRLPDGRIAVIGGYSASSTVLADARAFDPVTGTWSSLASLPLPLYAHAAVVAKDPSGDDVVFVFGGSSDPADPNNDRAVVEKYDISSDSWETVSLPSPMLASNHGMGAAMGCDGRIYVAGGRHGTPVFGTRVDAFDPATETWDATPADLNVARRFFGLVAGTDARLYAINGDDNTLCGTETVESFGVASPATPWAIEPPTSVPARGVSSVAFGMDVYVFAGSTHGTCGSIPVGRSDRFGALVGAFSVQGRVFHDIDCNGVWDAIEVPLSGWEVTATGPVTQTVTTDVNGFFTFTGLVAGSYWITESVPVGWTVSQPSSGIHFLTLDPGCGLTVEGIVFGNCDCTGSAGPEAQKCIIGYYTLDEGAGGTANDIAGNNNGSLVGAPIWSVGYSGQGSSLALNSASDYVEAPVTNSLLDFGDGSFSIVAWIHSNSNSGSIRAIADRRQGPFAEPKGVHVYVRAQTLGIQLATGVDGYANYEASDQGGTDVLDGTWHCVAATVCRNPANPSSNTVTLYVDGIQDAQWTGAVVMPGDVTPGGSVPLRIGSQSAGFTNGAFAGSIDDVHFYDCCLDPAQIFDVATSGPTSLTDCSVPSVVTAWGQTANTALTIANYSAVSQTYTWTAGPLPAGDCDVDGPTVFSPAAGSVTVGPGSYATQPFTITVPSGLVWPLTACYRVTVLNEANGTCCDTEGILKPYLWACIDDGGGALTEVPEGSTWGVRFGIANGSETAQVFDYQVVGSPRDGNPDRLALSLDGLPPGKPETGSFALNPGDSTTIVVMASFEEFQPFELYEVRLLADVDGLGYVPVAAAPVRGTLDVIVGVGEATAFDVATPARSLLVASPNPFRTETTLRLGLPGVGKASVVVLDVAGRRLRTFHTDGPSLRWDGRDERGRILPPGVYFVRGERSGVNATLKTVRIR